MEQPSAVLSHPPDPVSRRRHFVTLDGLRGMAAICVMLFHINAVFGGQKLLPNAFLAVDFFFILSGFVVAHAYGANLSSRKLRFRQFLARRIQRLYPLIIVGAAIGGAYWCAKDRAHAAFQLGLTILAMLSLPWLGLEGASKSIAPINPPGWSLVFELLGNVFYGAVARIVNGWFLAVIIVLSGISFAYLGLKADFVGYLGVFRDTFAGGIARVIFSFFVGVALQRSSGWIAELVPKIPGLALAFILFVTFLPPEFFRHAAIYELACIVIVYPFIVAAGICSTNGRAMGHVMLLSGELSYPLYILHVPVFLWLEAVFAKTHLDAYLHGTRAAFIAGPIAIAAAFAVSRFYDIPVRRWLGSIRFSSAPLFRRGNP